MRLQQCSVIYTWMHAGTFLCRDLHVNLHIGSSESLVTFEINCGTSVVVTWQISSEAYDYFTDVDVQFEYNCTDTRGHSEV